MPGCIEWGEDRHQECTETEDQGYNECSQEEDQGYNDCCDWWPCSWACDAWVWVSNIVCVGWTWVSNIVCIGWTWVTTAFCVVWDVVTLIINAILVTLESIFGWILSGLAFIIELLEMIPGLGTFIRWLINLITLIVWVLVGLLDGLLGWLGIRPEKKLRICTIILKDEKGDEVASVREVIPLLQLAVNIYKRDANVRLIPSKAWQYDTGFGDAETVDESWIQMDDGASDSDTLDVPCNAGSDWGLAGTKFQYKMSTRCFFGSWRRVLGYGAPLTCFVIREVTGNDIGCSLFITDYLTVDKDAIATSPRTIGHEIGHSCMLWHTCADDGNSNLMATSKGTWPAWDCDPESTVAIDRVDPVMHDWQALLIRSSKHVTYF